MIIALAALAAAQTGIYDISYRDVGAATPPGVPSTRRCLWTAVTPDGARLEGSRPGDCARNRRAIAREVARRTR